MATEIAKAYVQIIPEAADGAFSGVMSKQMQGAESAGDDAGKKAGNGFVKALKGIIVAAGIGKIIKDALTAGADLEQSIGGIETLFGDSADTMKAYAEQAYKTAGISANDYMQQSTSFAAALLSSLNNDTAKAADAANTAIIDMADNANKMGTSLESIQNAYQGFAKGNYTMLDNLKLGYGGTKTEMERLLKDAEKLSGVKYDIKNLSDVYSAIHVIQDELGITGTTAKEAATTFSGSMASMSAAWQNVLASLSTGTGVADALDGLIDTVKTFVVDNALPMISNVLVGIIPALSSAVQSILPAIIGALVDVLPNIVNGLLDGIIALIPVLMSAIPLIIDAIIKMIPTMLSGLINAVGNLFGGIATALPSVSKSIIDALPTLMREVASAIANAFPIILDAVITLAMSIVDQLPTIVSTIATALPSLISTFVSFISTALPKIVSSVISVLTKIITDTIPQLIKTIVTALPQIVTALVDALKSLIPMIVSVVPDLVTALVDMLPMLIDTVVTMATDLVTYLVNELPNIIQAIVDIVPDLINGIINALISISTLLIDAGVNLFTALVSDLPTIIRTIVGVIPTIIDSLVNVIVDNLPLIIQAGVDLLIGLVLAIPDIIKALVAAVPDIIDALVDAFDTLGDSMVKAGENLFNGLKDGIANILPSLIKKVKDAANDLIKAAKDVLGIHSPSRVFRDQIGENMMLGLAEGIADNAKPVTDAIDSVLDGTESAFDTSLNVGGALTTSTQMIADASTNGLLGNIMSAIEHLENMGIYLDSGKLVGGIVPDIDTALNVRSARAARGCV